MARSRPRYGHLGRRLSVGPRPTVRRNEACLAGPPPVVFSIAQAHTNCKRPQAQGPQSSYEKALQGNKPPALQGDRLQSGWQAVTPQLRSPGAQAESAACAGAPTRFPTLAPLLRQVRGSWLALWPLLPASSHCLSFQGLGWLVFFLTGMKFSLSSLGMAGISGAGGRK